MIYAESIVITHEFLAYISKIDEFKGSWKALGVLAPERLHSLRQVATIESIGSSTRIEGSRLSDSEIERILSQLETQSFATRDQQEVAGYAHVMEIVFESWQDIPFSENYIRQLHKELLKFSDKDKHHCGNYKTLSNSVAAFDVDGKEIGVVFETASPFETPERMRELIHWTNEKLRSKATHPLLVISIFIVTFLEIHPFQDGNGRLSRVLTTILLLKAGYLYVPYSSLESIIERNKEGYYLALRRTQSTMHTSQPNWQPWIKYFLSSLVKQVDSLAEKVKREKILLNTLPSLSIAILEQIRHHGKVTMADMIVLSGKSRNTLKDHFRSLQDLGHIKINGKGKGSWYSKP